MTRKYFKEELEYLFSGSAGAVAVPGGAKTFFERSLRRTGRTGSQIAVAVWVGIPLAPVQIPCEINISFFLIFFYQHQA